MSALEDRLMADYLERLRRELQTSPEEAEEVLREIRSHIECAVQDLGQGDDERSACLDRALQQFGEAAQIGQALRQVHGRATWLETGLAVLPLFLFGWLAYTFPLPVWLAPLLLGLAAALAWRTGWPLWWWAWLGWLPFAVPNAPNTVQWGILAYVLILLLIRRRNWLEATLALYPLPTAWAFHYVAMQAREVQNVGWSTAAHAWIGLGMAVTWALLLARMLRTCSGNARIFRALQGQAALLGANALVVVAARLWPTYPYPYSFTLRYFVFVTIPYGIYHGLPFLLFFVLTALPALLTLLRTRIQRQPPSRPLWSG